MKMNSRDSTGIMNTTLMKSVLLTSRMNDAMTQQRHTKPAEE